MNRASLAAMVRNHPQLVAGLAVVFVVVAFGPVGSLFVDTDLSRVGSAPANLTPTVDHLLGTDAAGRDLLAVMVAGTPLTLWVGFVAGVVGLGIGTILGFVAGYFGGWIDTVIRGAADVLMTIPGLLFLVVLATSLHTTVTVNMMALVVASCTPWVWIIRGEKGPSDCRATQAWRTRGVNCSVAASIAWALASAALGHPGPL